MTAPCMSDAQHLRISLCVKRILLRRKCWHFSTALFSRAARMERTNSCLRSSNRSETRSLHALSTIMIYPVCQCRLAESAHFRSSRLMLHIPCQRPSAYFMNRVCLLAEHLPTATAIIASQRAQYWRSRLLLAVLPSHNSKVRCCCQKLLLRAG